jgi:hypothetical protein
MGKGVCFMWIAGCKELCEMIEIQSKYGALI